MSVAFKFRIRFDAGRLPTVPFNIYLCYASCVFFSSGGSAAPSSWKETTITDHSSIPTSDWLGKHEHSQWVQQSIAKTRFSFMFDRISRYPGTRRSRYHSLDSCYRNSILDLNERAKASVTKKVKTKAELEDQYAYDPNTVKMKILFRNSEPNSKIPPFRPAANWFQKLIDLPHTRL